MKKTVRNIIIMLAVLAVLGGAVALLLLFPSGDQEAESSSSAPSSSPKETVLEIDEATVSSIEIDNQKGGFTLVPDPNGESEGVNFTIEDYEKYEMNKGQVTANARALLSMEATRNLGAREDREAFGLTGEDAATVTIHHDGGSDTLILGGSAAESSGKYVEKDGQIYIVSNVPTQFYGSCFIYFDTDVYTIADRMEETVDEEGNTTETKGMDIMETITFSGKQFPEPITIEHNTIEVTNGYLMTEPVTAESGTTAYSELVTSLKSLTAEAVSSIGTDSANLERHGLLEPDAKIRFTLNGSKHELAVSAKDKEGYRFLTVDDSDVIYLVKNETVSGWAETNVTSLRMSYIWIHNIKDVETLTITRDGDEVYEFHITRTVNEEKTTEKNTEYDLSITNAGGETVDYSEAYQPFYQKVIGLAVFSQEKVEFTGTPDYKIEYKYFGGGGDTVELYKMKEQNRYVAVLNGKFNGQVRGSEVDDVMESIP